MKKISRRQFMAAMGAVAAAGALAGCSGGSTGGGSTGGQTQTEPNEDISYEVTEPIEIVWWHALEEHYTDLVNEVVDGFNKSQDLITVKAEYIGAYKEINEALVSANAAKAGLPAVVVANTDYVASYGASGLYENLDPYIAATGFDTEDYATGLLLSSQYDGKQVALPFLHSTQIMYYNKDMAKERGLTIPDNIDDFETFLGEATVIENGETSVYGTIIPGWDQWYFEPMYLNEGVKVITEDNACDLNSETALGVTQRIRSWIDKGYTYWGAGKESSDAMRQKFFESKAFSVVHTSSLYNMYVDKCDFEVGMAWLPAGTTGSKNHEVGGCVVGIPSNNDQQVKNAAWQFLQYLTGKEVNMKWAKGTGYLPTRKSVLYTDEGKKFLEEKPEFQCIFDNLDLINPRIQNAKWGELATIWKQYMEMMLAQDYDVVEQSDLMVEEINDVLSD